MGGKDDSGFLLLDCPDLGNPNRPPRSAQGGSLGAASTQEAHGWGCWRGQGGQGGGVIYVEFVVLMACVKTCSCQPREEKGPHFAVICTHHFVDGGRGEWLRVSGLSAPRLHDSAALCDIALVEDLGPPVFCSACENGEKTIRQGRSAKPCRIPTGGTGIETRKCDRRESMCVRNRVTVKISSTYSQLVHGVSGARQAAAVPPRQG